MEKHIQRLIVMCLCLAMLAMPVFWVMPAEAVAAGDVVPQKHYGSYGTLAMAYDQGSCGSMQGMTADNTYTYCVKINGSDTQAVVLRTEKSTGTKVHMTDASTGSTVFTNLGHANALDIVSLNGASNLFVTAGATLVRLTVSGTTLTTAGTYTASYNGATASMTAVQIMSASNDQVKVIVKNGRTLYTGTLDPKASSGDIALTKLCTLNISEVRLKGETIDYSAFTQQGFDYHDGKIFLPLTGNASVETINVSVVLVYDLEGAAGTIKNDPTLSFRIISGTYAGLFEIEDCVVCPTTGQLYFCANRRKSSTDTNYDGVSYFLDYVYDPAMSTTHADDYRWETIGDRFTSVTDGGNTFNEATQFHGKIADGTMSNAIFSLSRSVILAHDKPWIVEWRSTGTFSSGSMILATSRTWGITDSPFLFRYKQSEFIAIGYWNGSQHNNYGIRLGDYGIDGTADHVYRVTNKVGSDGSNMVYLSVDGVELGAMNNYYINATAQGTTSDWISGKDFTFNYLGSYGHPLTNCDMEYLQVWADGLPEDSADTYRWETQSDDLVSVTGSALTENGTTIYRGSVSGGIYTSAAFRMDQAVVLRHDRSWSVEWQSDGAPSGGTFLLASSDGGNTKGAPYLFRYGADLIFLGAYDGSSHMNYGIDLSDYGIDGSASHSYRLTNKVAADGSNMVWLSVDDVELGAMDNVYKGINAQGTTSDWLSGRDLVFDYMGNSAYPISGHSIDHIQVWEACDHSFSDWVGSDATCTADGQWTRSCTRCGYRESKTSAATGHDYSVTSYPGSCLELERDVYVCSLCDDSYDVYPEASMSDWVETLPEGVDMSLVETKTQYRWSDSETMTSYETSLEGYTQIGSEWVKSGSGTVAYVPSWTAGFSTSSNLYTQYDKVGSKVTASETATAKTVIESDGVAGYLYHHWCYSGSYYSVQSSSGSYTTFHAFYSTTAPSGLSGYDETDGSYYYPNSTTCSNSDWWWPTAVYEQSYTTYEHLFTYERWTDWSDWSDTTVTASDTRKVETRTVYRYVDAQLGDHDFVDGSCTVCGVECEHSWSEGACSVCGMSCGHTSHDGSGVCSTCGETVGHRYETVITLATCTTGGLDTHTCSICGDSYRDNFSAPKGHSYVDGVCGDCGVKCSHSSHGTDGICTKCGVEAGHDYTAVVTAPTCTAAGYTTYTCSHCGHSETGDDVAANGHSYSEGVCTVCGEADPDAVAQPTLTLRYPSLSFEAEILYNVYFVAENLGDVEEMGLATFDSELTDGTVEDATDVIPGFETDGSIWKVGTNGISAKNLGDTLYFKVYAKLTDGTYVYTAMKSYSAVTYANTILGRSTSSSYMKSLVVAMLNYGTEAQLYFGHNTDTLMNAGLTAEQQALVSAYDESMMDAVVSVDNAKAGDLVYDGSSFARRAPTVSFDGAFAINYYFTAANAPDDGMTLYYWNIADYTAASVLTLDNATGSMEMVTTDVENQYWGQVSGIAAKELDYTVFVVGVYECDGVTYTTGVLNYSIGKYCEGIAANSASTQQAFAQATAVYGYCAKEYFANL